MVQCVSDRLQLFTPSVAAVVRRLDLVVSCQPNFLMMAFSCGLYGMLMILETCHLFYGYFKWPVPQMPRAPTTSATCVWEGKKFRKEAKGKFLTNIQCFPPSPPAAPTPRAPLQPCSELAGVFLYKRPILWDARIAMEAFEGHHTKAQRQKGRL